TCRLRHVELEHEAGDLAGLERAAVEAGEGDLALDAERGGVAAAAAEGGAEVGALGEDAQELLHARPHPRLVAARRGGADDRLEAGGARAELLVPLDLGEQRP